LHNFQHPTYPLQAVPDLLEYGAQFVLCDYWGNRKTDGSQSKKPVHRNWRRQRPGFDAVKDHITSGGLLGIVPASLGYAVLDVDHGNPTALIATHLPWFLSPTQRPQRLHLWYQDPRGDRRGGRWRHESGCGGELLASTGYVVLWAHALQDLADALQDDIFGQGDQVDFDTVASAAGMTWAGPGEQLNRTEREITAADLPELADVLPGRRNVALFDHVRYYAYRQVKHHTEFMDFAGEVASFADSCRDQLLDVEGFPESEAKGIAKSVAMWTWTVFARDGGGQRPEANNPTTTSRRPALGDAGYRGDPALNADSEVQRYRRSCRTQLDGLRVAGRIELAAARSVTGWPVARVATMIGVSQRQAQRYLAAAELPSKRQAKRTLAVQHAKARRAAEYQASKADSGTGTLTGREGTGAHNGNWQRELSDNRPVRGGSATPHSKNLVKTDAASSPPLIMGWCRNRARNRPGTAPAPLQETVSMPRRTRNRLQGQGFIKDFQGGRLGAQIGAPWRVKRREPRHRPSSRYNRRNT